MSRLKKNKSSFLNKGYFYSDNEEAEDIASEEKTNDDGTGAGGPFIAAIPVGEGAEPQNSPLSHGQYWCSAGEVTFDARRCRGHTTFNWPRLCTAPVKAPFQCFMLQLPVTMISPIVATPIGELDNRFEGGPFHQTALLRCLGIRLKIALERKNKLYC